jgi:pSer/pThr/pTyr-binding forkhead associated (FHA) protein
MVEDLGSANGTWINDKRVHTGMLSPGDELRLDTVRFLLLAPGSQPPPAPAHAVEAVEQPAQSSGSVVGWIIGAMVLIGAIAAGVLKYLDKF